MSSSGTVTCDERTASYQVIGGSVRVTSELGVKTAQLRRTPAEILARMLLRELMADAERDGFG